MFYEVSMDFYSRFLKLNLGGVTWLFHSPTAGMLQSGVQPGAL